MLIPCERGQTFVCDPARTALLCVDFQADFLADGGMAAERGLPFLELQRVIAPARRVLHGARRVGMKVIHLRECYAPDLSDLNPFRKFRDSIIGSQGPLGRFLIRGEAGTRIIAELAPLPDELVIDKASFNAFYRTRLHEVLQEGGITHIVLLGVTTQVCVSSTLRGAVDCGYFPLLLNDCCAAFRQEDHEASVSVIFAENHQFGWVSDSARLLSAFEVHV